VTWASVSVFRYSASYIVWDEGHVYIRVCLIIMMVCLYINIAYANDVMSFRMASE
jgi:hypothetical protein